MRANVKKKKKEMKTFVARNHSLDRVSCSSTESAQLHDMARDASHYICAFNNRKGEGQVRIRFY